MPALARISEPEIYFDVETLKLSNEVPGGWANIKDFGLAVAVTWNSEAGFRRWFEPDAALLVSELERFDRIVSFNGERFDFAVLSAYRNVDVLRSRSFDVLRDLTARLGHRVKLDDVAHGTLGRRKIGDGLQSVQWWREGQTERVASYCEEDVAVLRDIVEHGRQKGYVLIDGTQTKVDWSHEALSLSQKARAAKAR